MKRITIRMDDDTYEKLRWLSYRDKQSRHAIILKILQKAFEEVDVPSEVKE